MLEKFIDNDVMGFERVLRDIEKILLLIKSLFINIVVFYCISSIILIHTYDNNCYDPLSVNGMTLLWIAQIYIVQVRTLSC